MEYLFVLFSLLFVLGLMVLAAWGIKKMGLAEGNSFLNPLPPKNITLLEQISLDTKRKIVLVKIGKENYALLTSPQGDVVIDKNITLEKVKALKSSSQDK